MSRAQVKSRPRLVPVSSRAASCSTPDGSGGSNIPGYLELAGNGGQFGLLVCSRSASTATRAFLDLLQGLI